MSPFIVEEGWFLLYSVLLGVAITFVYDCLRIFRRVSPHGIFWISLEDMVYWIFVAFSIFYMLYYENDGAFRWFAIFGMILGMFLFNKTLSPFFVKYISRFLLWIKKLIYKLNSFLTKPLRMVGNAAGKKASAGKRKVKQFVRILKKRLTVWARMAKMILCKRCRKVQRGRKNG